MTTDLPPIDYLVTSTGSWNIYNNTHFEASFITNWGSDVLVPDSYLAQAHPLFPDVLRAVILLQKEYKMDVPISGRLAYASLCLLKGELLSFTNINGENVYLSKVTQIFVGENTVGIRGTHLYVDDVVIAGCTQQIVSFQQVDTVDVSKSALDLRFPGWELRYNVCIELGMDFDESLNNIFTNIEVSNAQMDTVTFP